MPTLAELFPNLAKLKKDDPYGAPVDPFTGFASGQRSPERPSNPLSRPPARPGSRKEPTLKVGGPTRSKRSAPDAAAPLHQPGLALGSASVPAPGPASVPAPDPASCPPPVQERRLEDERRAGLEARSGAERRLRIEAPPMHDRRSDEDPRSGEDMRSGSDRRRDTSGQSAGFSPLASVARFAIGRLSGARRASGPSRRAAGDPADAAGEVDAAAGAPPATKRAFGGRRGSLSGAPSVAKLGGAPNLAKLGGLGSVKNMNVSLGRRGGRGASLVGLDIQPGYVAAVEADVNGVVAVKRAVGMSLPADTMRDGEVIDPALLAEVLQELFTKGGLSKRVRVGLANQRTVVRTMELPPIEDRKELAAAVRFQAQDQMPMPLASAVLDFQPLGIVETPAGKRQRVVVVAAQREMVQRLVSAVSAAGLRPEAVDLSAFAMIRALYRPDEAVRRLPAAAAGPAGGVDGAGAAEAGGGGAEADGDVDRTADEASSRSRTLFLNVGGLTNLAIAEGVTCRFTRAVGGGLESMAGALAERRNVPLVDARASIASFDLTRREALLGSAPGAPVGPAGGIPAGGMSAAPPLPGERAVEAPAERLGEAAPVQGAPAGAIVESEPSAAAAEVRAVIAGGLREIAGEVRNSLDYHRAQESGGTVEGVVLSGAALEINGFASALEAELGFRVQRRSVASSRGGDLNHTPAERLAIAAGLAVEEVAR